MSPTKIWLREVPYTIYCCGCDIEMHRGQQMVQTATLRLRGYQVRLCLACAEEVGKLTAYRPGGLAQPDHIVDANKKAQPEQEPVMHKYSLELSDGR